MVQSTFRVDTTDTETIQTIIDEYLKLHPQSKYCINHEISDIRHKHHLQGWFDVPTAKTVKVFRNYMATHIKSSLGISGSAYAFEDIHKEPNYFAYIINNEKKPDTSYSDLMTNYTEEEFNQLKSRFTFVKLPPLTKGRKATTKSYQDKVLDTLEEKCVKDGKIQYTKIPDIYLGLAPSLQMDKPIARKNCLGYTLRLENRNPSSENTLARDYLFDALQTDDKGKFSIFHPEYTRDYNPDYNHRCMHDT